MTIPRLAQPLALCSVIALGLLAIVASNPAPTPSGPPAVPTLLSLQIPSDTFGAGFSGVTPAIAAAAEMPATATMPSTPAVPANYFVLPLLTTTAPIVRVVLEMPVNTSLAVTAGDMSRNQTASLPMISPPGPSSPGPTTGYVFLHSVTSNSTLFYIRYPNSFQGSKLIRTMLAATAGGTAGAPLLFDLSFRGSTVNVSIVSENNDGRVTSNPPGIDCPGVCAFDFLGSSSVSLMQSVSRNATEFIGWTGNCGGNQCQVQLLAPGPGVIPVNAAVTANFRVHVNAAIPPTFGCGTAPLVPGWRWAGQPNCGSPAPLGATLSCDAQGNYFCCGASAGAPSTRCSGQNETAATCARDSLGVFGSNQRFINPGGCYEPAR